MKKGLTFDEALEQIKNEGQKEREVIECAEKTAAIIEKLVRERLAQGITQRDLAEKCGMKQAAIARIESLQVMPRIDTLVRIANGLDVTIDIVEKEDEKASFTMNWKADLIGKAEIFSSVLVAA